MKIAIAAAGGNVGSRIAKKLENEKLVLLGRDVEKLKRLGIATAELVATDISQAEQVIAATKGVDALFWMVPPLMTVPSLKVWYQQVTAAGIAAVKANNIRKVVLLSALGAGAADNQGVVSFCGEMEVAFAALDCDVLALRPGYFLENLIMQRENIEQRGVIKSPYLPDHGIPFISTDDIGDVAAAYLADTAWHGKWQRNLMGPENVSLHQVCERVGAMIGKKVAYEHVSMDVLLQMLAKEGMSETVKQEMRELGDALTDVNGVYAAPRTYEVFTPTRLEDVVRGKVIPAIF